MDTPSMCDTSSGCPERIAQTIAWEMSRYDRPEAWKALTWAVPQQQKTEQRNWEKCRRLLKDHISQVKNSDNYFDVASKPTWKNAFQHIRNFRENRLSLFFFFVNFGAKMLAFRTFLILLLTVPFLTSSHFSLLNGFAPVEQHMDAHKGEEQGMTPKPRKIKL